MAALGGVPPPIVAPSTLQNYQQAARAPSVTASQSFASLRTTSNKKTIYDRNLNRSRNAELSRASFAYLFMEMVLHAQKKVTGIQDLEKKLNEQGYPLGLKL